MKELSDLAVPAAIERKPLLEREIQKQCVDWIRARGYWARKFSSQSQRSVPDYLFGRALTLDLFTGRRVKAVKLATEFKREDAKVDKKTGLMSTEAQVEEQIAMRTAGWYVFECNDFDAFRETIREYEKDNLC